jgi:hypothetical protein
MPRAVVAKIFKLVPIVGSTTIQKAVVYITSHKTRVTVVDFYVKEGDVGVFFFIGTGIEAPDKNIRVTERSFLRVRSQGLWMGVAELFTTLKFHDDFSKCEIGTDVTGSFKLTDFELPFTLMCNGICRGCNSCSTIDAACQQTYRHLWSLYEMGNFPNWKGELHSVLQNFSKQLMRSRKSFTAKANGKSHTFFAYGMADLTSQLQKILGTEYKVTLTENEKHVSYNDLKEQHLYNWRKYDPLI